MKYISIECF